MKFCTQCKIEKPCSEFGKHKNGANGLRSICKICNCNYAKRYYHNISKHNNNYKEHKKKYIKSWHQKNPTYANVYTLVKRIEDINYKLSFNLRCRLNKALILHLKSGSAVMDLGCSIDEFKIYLESKFQSGMTWENYGLYGWHMDHIIPLSSFNLSDRNEFLKAAHYTNIQPLWAEQNLIKSNKLVNTDLGNK